MQDAGGAGDQPPSARGGSGGGGSAAAAREVRRPPLPPARPASAGNNSLHSYVSEPPCSLAALKAYAQELVKQQGQEPGSTAEQQHPADGSIPAAPRSGLSSSDGIELPQLSAGAKASVFERLPHFQLGAQLAAPAQQPAQGETAGDAARGGAPPLRPRMRTSIGEHGFNRGQRVHAKGRCHGLVLCVPGSTCWMPAT